MKKFLSLVLALALLCGCTAAMADTYADHGAYANGGLVDAGSVYATETIVPGTTYTVDVTLPTWLVPTSATIYAANVPADAKVTSATVTPVQLANGQWSVDITTPGMDQDATMDECEQKYVIEYTDGTNYYYVNYYINALGNGSVIGTFDAYYQGHATAFGPKVDGSWKTYAVVDLSVQGVQSYKLIASGGWYLGTVTVAVDGDQVVVDYLMAEDVKTNDVHDDLIVKSEYVNIYADAASIDMSAESAYTFGTPISIANDLAGDTVVCVFVDLETAYNVSSPFVTRFWPNMRENKNIVEAMNALLAE